MMSESFKLDIFFFLLCQKTFKSSPRYVALTSDLPQSGTIQSCKIMNTEASVSHGAPVYSHLMWVPNYTASCQRQMCVNNLSKVAHDSRAAGML